MDIFVKRPVIAIVISLALLLAGISAALSIPVLQFPKLESSNLVVSTIYPGASADVVQGFITDPIERVAMTVPGVDYVDSRTTAGLSTVTVWLDLNENSTDALAELTSRLNQIQFELPFDALDPSIDVVRSDQANALFYLTVVNEGWSRSDLTDYLSRNVSPLLTGIDGVQRIGLDGGRSPAMRVWMDPLRLASVGIGADEVFAALRNNNVLSALGRTESDARQLNLLTNATLQSVEDFEDLIISNQGGTLVRLRDVARVELGEDRGEDLSRIDDSATVFVSVWSVPGANAIEIGDAVYERLGAINATLPEGLGIEIAYDATVYMRHALRRSARITCPFGGRFCYGRRYERGNASGAREVQRAEAAVGRTHAAPLGCGGSPRHWTRGDCAGCRGDRAVARHGSGRRAGTGFGHAAGAGGGRASGARSGGRTQGAGGSRSGPRAGVGASARPVHTGRPAGAAALDLQQRGALGGATGGGRTSGQRAHGEPPAARAGL